MMADRWPRVQFVDAPDLSANVRYDLNDGDAGPLAEGWSLGSPALQGDPDSVGTKWLPRELSFTQAIDGSISEGRDVEWHINALRREMYRRSNWLLFHLSPEKPPVWFQTYRSDSGPLDFDELFDNQDQHDWELPVKLAARPWAIGERVTHTFNYQTNPRTDRGTVEDGRLSLQLPQIKGELPPPLRVKWSVLASSGTSYRTVKDGWFAVSPTSQQTHIYWYLPVNGTAPSAVPPGRYRVVAMYDTAGGPQRFGISLDGGTTPIWTTNAPVTTGRTLTVISGMTYQWRDLGEITIRSSDGEPIAPYLKFDTTGIGGSPHWAVQLIPILEDGVDELASIMEKVSAPTAAGTSSNIYPDYFVLDDSEDHDHQCIRNASTTIPGNLLPARVSGASRLLAHPQWENRLYLLGNTAVDGSGVAQVEVSYRPLYTDVANL